MDTDQTIFWGVVAAAFCLPLVFASRDKTKGRLAYLLRTIPIQFGFWILFGLASKLIEDVLLATFALMLVLLVLFMLWTVHRLNDIGWSRFTAVVMPLVPIGTVFWIVLLVRGGRPAYRPDEPEPFDVFD